MSKYSIFRAVVIGLGDKSLIQIRDWDKNRVTFRKGITSFPSDEEFHAFVVAVFKWLKTKLSEYNNANSRDTLRMEGALSCQENAIRVFAPFLRKHTVPAGSEVEAKVKKAKANRRNVVESDSDSGSDGSESDADDDADDDDADDADSHADGDADDSESDAESGKGSIQENQREESLKTRGHAGQARGGCVAVQPSRTAKPFKQQHEESIEGLLREYQISMRGQFQKKQVGTNIIGCSSQIPPEAYTAYEKIKRHSDFRSSGLGTIEYLVQKNVIQDQGNGVCSIMNPN